jgi:hypothetical protein
MEDCSDSYTSSGLECESDQESILTSEWAEDSGFGALNTGILCIEDNY